VSGRGNKTSEDTRTKRAKRVIELAQAGATKQEIATDIGVSRVTLWRYLQALDVQFVESNRDAIAELKKKVASEVAQQADNVLSGELNPRAALAWNGLISTFNKMLGLNAAIKTITARIDVPNAAVQGAYVEFNKLVCRKMKSWDKIAAFIESCPDDEEGETLCLP
jgi:hypothetical protein